MGKLILILISLFPVIDTFMGFFSNNESIIGIALKTCVLFLMIIYIFIVLQNKIILILLLLVPVFYAIHISKSDLDLTTELASIIKIFYYFISCLFFFSIRNNQELYKYVVLILKIGFITISFNVICGLMGYGDYTYKALQYGVKGFIYAGNEMSFLLVLLTSLLVWVYRLYSIKVYFLLVISLFLGVCIATKSAIIANLIILITYMVVMNKVKIYHFLIGSICLFFIIPHVIQSDFFAANIERFNNSSIIDFMSSSRLDYFDYIWSSIKNINLDVFLFGYGRTYIKSFGIGGTEMDIVDIFLWHGAIFVILVVAFILIVYKSMMYSKYKDKSYLIITFTLIIMMSMFAGHIITSGMISPVLGLFIYFSINKNEGIEYD